MKTINTKLIYLILSIFFMFSLSVQAQTDKRESEPVEDRCNQELILGVPKVSEKNLFLLTETAAKMNGIKYIDFCEKDKLLLLKYNQEMYPRPEDVIKAFHAQNIVMPMMVKIGKFDSVVEMCVKQVTK